MNDLELAYAHLLKALVDIDTNGVDRLMLADRLSKSLESLFVTIREEAWAEGYFEGGGLNG